MKKHIVIIGSGLAGYMLAKEFRKLDKETSLTIITKNNGDFYSKPQLSTALTLKKHADNLSMGSSDKMSQQLNATIITNVQVNKIDTDAQKVLHDKGEVAYTSLVLAVGAEKLQAPLSGDAINEVQSVNHLEEYASFREWLEGKKHVAIIGAGLVGCEFANDLVNHGCKVSVFAPEKWPLMSLLPEEIGKVLKKALAEQGVDWHLCRFAERVDKTDEGIRLSTTVADAVNVDGVFSAIGLKSNTALAKAAGITVKEGIQVNKLLETSVKNIYALGDCAEVEGYVKQYVAPLLQCARALAKILSGDASPVLYPAMPVIIKTPACPLALLPPEKGVQGHWKVEGAGNDLKALFYNTQEELVGFALSGSCVSQKMELVKQMPVLL